MQNVPNLVAPFGGVFWCRWLLYPRGRTICCVFYSKRMPPLSLTWKSIAILIYLHILLMNWFYHVLKTIIVCDNKQWLDVVQKLSS